MLTENELIINKVAQNMLTLNQGLHWFRNLDTKGNRCILELLKLYLEQAHPNQKLIDDSLVKIPIKESMTPIVLFKKYPYKIAIRYVCNLPDNELEKSFITLLTLFKYADTTRRELYCKNGCSHEWHNLVNI